MGMPALRNLLAASITLLVHQHAAAEVRYGEPVAAEAYCGASNTTGPGMQTRAGYDIDRAAELPKLGEVTYVSAFTTNKNCVGDAAQLDFFLPDGAVPAISAQHPVTCTLYSHFTSNGAYRSSGPAAGCQQSWSKGPLGGLTFLPATFLAPRNSTEEWSLEVRVPVVFNAVTDNATLTVGTDSTWLDTYAEVDVTVPFQPDLPYSTRGDDIGLLGSALVEAGTLPVAFSNDNGSFTVTNYPITDFAEWAKAPNVKRLSGDFNRDGLTDYALVGGPGWRTIPVAMSRGNGRFTVTNTWVGDFGVWAETANVTPLAGDFNRDGHTDIALVGGAGWASIPVAFSARGGGNGFFEVTNLYVGSFAGWATTSGARPFTGDFNRDGMTDIALIGGAGWTTLPVAFSYGNGTFHVTNGNVRYVAWSYHGPSVMDFAAATREAGAQTVTGDFNKDGMTDFAVIGGVYSHAIFTALSYGDGTFDLGWDTENDFVSWSKLPGAKVLTGDFNKDGYTDLALTGVAGWNTIPVATSANGGNFNITNMGVGDFGTWSSTPGVRHLVGDFNGDGFSDIALVGANGWASIPVALGVGNGIFAPINAGTNRMPRWASDSGATALVGHVNY